MYNYTIYTSTMFNEYILEISGTVSCLSKSFKFLQFPSIPGSREVSAPLRHKKNTWIPIEKSDIAKRRGAFRTKHECRWSTSFIYRKTLGFVQIGSLN